MRRAALACCMALLAPAAARGAEASPRPVIDGLVDSYFHAVFDFNRFVYRQLDRMLGGPDLPGGDILAAAGEGAARMLGNLVNEPITMAASLLVGDVTTAGHAAERFAINSTAGVLGFYDRASDWGLPSRHADFGLGLCRLGVGEGGFVMLPFIGPRTVRDGISDVVLTNLVLWPVVGGLAGGGVSLRTIAIAETVEIAADIVATRQIDPVARRFRFDDYEAVRAAYLAERRARCAGAAF